MALSLTADQKNINHIYNSSDIYIVPSYQRPYSWEYDQCYQLYSDLTTAYNSSSEYFMGNIIIAKGKDASGKFYTVDGQQRIITIWLLMRVLLLIYPMSKVLRKKTEIESRIEGMESIPSVMSEVFENKDGEALRRVYEIKNVEELANLYRDKSNLQGRVIESRCIDRIEANTLWFYYWFSEFQQRDNELCQGFIDFLLDHIYMLPIELSDESISAANDRALKIFETINNRGKNLEDADIFKAKLYDKAMAMHEGQSFVEDWSTFRIEVEKMGMTVDDVFRYYSHIIRGKQGITTSLINLREFFTESSFSPLLTQPYKEVMSNLWDVISSLSLINGWKVANCENEKEEEVAKWIQVLDCYTNQYPSFAVLTYLYVRGYSDNTHKEFVNFLKELVRYSYLVGATTTVKFEVFNIIKRIATNESVLIPSEVFKTFDKVEYPTLLRKGFALLAYYLKGGKLLKRYSIDKIITQGALKENTLFNQEINSSNLDGVIQKIGNDILIQEKKKRRSSEDKLYLLTLPEYSQYRVFFSDSDYSVAIEKRTEELELLFTNFFLYDANN